MTYEDTLRRKSTILVRTLFLCIILRAIVNCIFVGVAQVVPFLIAGIVIFGLLYFAVKKISPVIMMYVLPVIISVFTIALMLAFPCTANYLMFFLCIFFVVIYEDFRPILMQCVISAVCMIVFFNRYQQKLSDTWSTDTMAICIVYIISGCLVFISMSRLNKESFDAVMSSSHNSEVQSERAASLLTEITGSLDVLDETSKKIADSIDSSSSVSTEISATSQDVASDAKSVADQTTKIRDKVQESSDKIAQMTESTAQMKSLSQETASNVHKGNQLITDLSGKMKNLSDTMTEVSAAVGQLSEQVTNISEILQNVRDISSQTNLLSLNASIEAARAGEAGRGFAVVAEQIRGLSDSSAGFSDQIGDIITEVSDQMQKVVDELNGSMSDVKDCGEYADTVASSFAEINANTDKVLGSSTDIEKSTNEMKELLDTTLTDVSSISESMSTTSEAMEGISSGIGDLNESIESITDGYKDIVRIADSLTAAAKKNNAAN